MDDAGKQNSEGGARPVQVRAPVSDDVEGQKEMWRNADAKHAIQEMVHHQETVHNEESNGNDEIKEGDWRDDADGNFSDCSDDSFDSAFERMVAATTGSLNAASSPHTAYSPMGSLGASAMFDYSSPMDMSQQGALMRLNKMLNGDESLDTSVIENCTDEDFVERIDHLARSRGQSLEDASFGSIVDALLPLVQASRKEKAQPKSGLKNEGTEGGGEGENAADRPNEARDAHPPAPPCREGNEFQAKDDKRLETSDSSVVADDATANCDGVTDGGGEDLEQRDGHDTEKRARVIWKDESDGTRPKAKLSAEDLDYGNGGCEPTKEHGGLHQGSELQEGAQTRPVAKLSEDDLNVSWRGGKGTDDRPRELEGEHGETKKGAETLSNSKSATKFAVTDDPRVRDRKLVYRDETHLLGNLPESTDGKTFANGGRDSYAEANGMEGDDEATDIESEEDEDDTRDGEDVDGKPSETSSSDLPALDYISTNSSPDEFSQESRLRMNPVRIGQSSPPLEPTTPSQQQQQPRRVTSPQVTTTFADGRRHANGEGGAQVHHVEPRDKLEIMKVQFLRLALRLGQSTRNVVVEQVLYRLGLAEQLRGGRGSNNRGSAFSFDFAREIAEEQEAAAASAACPEDLDFTCTIMLLGKTGVGKSATINSIFDEKKTETDAFSPSTKKVQVITGHVHGIRVRVIDTPGLLPAAADQRQNERVMSSVKQFIRKQTPDIVLYFDRLDMQSRDFSDLPLLRTITNTFGVAVWFNAIVVLTHAASAPPEGPNGLALSYEMFVAQRSHVVQQTIRQAVEDMHLMNPVSLVENHASCRVNQYKERVLPNGLVWKPQLLLLCFASKILAEANALLKLQDSTPGKPFGTGTRAPPLPLLLSSLLQARAQVRLPVGQVGKDEPGSDDDASVQGFEDEDDGFEFDHLPPFRHLANKEFMELDEENRCKYNEELAERERLFQKKLRKEERLRRRELRTKMAGGHVDPSQIVLNDAVESERSEVPTSLPVLLPDMVLPPSFDSDNPTYRYRYLESANQWLVRPVVESHGWDHDSGFDGMSLEKMFVVGSKVPVIVSGQFTKDKGDLSLNMECSTSLKHGVGKYTLAGLDMQTVGKDVAYTLRSETRFSSFKSNKTTGGLALTLLGDTVSGGLKIEDQLSIGKLAKVILSGGIMTGRNDVAYGGSMEASFRDDSHPRSQMMSSLGISVMDWHGEVAVGGNVQSQCLVGKTMLIGTGNFNNRGAGQITMKVSSSEQFRMALIGVLPIVRVFVNRFLWAQSQ